MRRICVFCGSAPGARPDYADKARQLAAALAQRNHGLVYGGGHVGLMGIVADHALALGCEVIGVIPEALHEREVGHRGLSQLHIVASMHERKAKMAEFADGFIALPGGLGTLEETFEVWTWAMLGIHSKPIALLDVLDYWRPLIDMVDRMVDEGFIVPKYREMLLVDDDPSALLDRMQAWTPPELGKWLTPDEA